MTATAENTELKTHARRWLKRGAAAYNPFCITIDTQGRDYLPHMYGAAKYVVIDEVGKLPLKIANIYRRLTI